MSARPPTAGRGRSPLRWAQERDWQARGWIRIIAMAFFLAPLAFLLHRGDDSAAVDHGMWVVGTSARDAIRAPHAFTWSRQTSPSLAEDVAAARSSSPIVVHYDLGIKDQVINRVINAFHPMRRDFSALARAKRRDALVAEQTRGEGLDEGPREGPASPMEAERAQTARVEAELRQLERTLSYEAWIDVLSEEERIAIMEAPGSETLAEFLRQLQRSSRAEIYTELARHGFSERVEEALRRIISVSMDRMLVADRAVLDAQARHGILLRTVRHGRTLNDTYLTDTTLFVGLDQVADHVERSASLVLSTIENRRLMEALKDLSVSLITANAALHHEATEALRQQREDEVRSNAMVTREFHRGDVIVERGQTITPDLRDMLHAMEASRPTSRASDITRLAIALLAFLVMVPLVSLYRRDLRPTTQPGRDLTMMGTLLFLQLAVIRGWVEITESLRADPGLLGGAALVLLAPMAAGAMLVRITTNTANALLFSVAFAVLVAFLGDMEMTLPVVALVGSLVGVSEMRSVQSRGGLFRAGLAVGVMSALAWVGLALVQGGWTQGAVGYGALFALVGGLLASAVALVGMQFLEWVFGYLTWARLQELLDLNHEALNKLLFEAPGSYHHSMMVSQLVEAGCEAVGANALLGRVGAFYHDIGKAKNPPFFAENQSGINPHDKLRPEESARIIKAHVSDGVELAKKHRLPKPIIAFIEEHHGTSRIEYFFNRACEQQGEEHVNENDYRYDGPKPRTRETAICLLADGIEAKARAQKEKTPEVLQQVVRSMLDKALDDHQLDGCGLTMQDLKALEDAFRTRLATIYHHRPVYPDARRTQPLGAASGRDTPLPPTRASETSGAHGSSHLPAEPTPSPTPGPMAPAEDPGDRPGGRS